MFPRVFELEIAKPVCVLMSVYVISFAGNILSWTIYYV